MNDSIFILIKLVCVHVLADFPLQCDRIVEGKKKKGREGVLWNILHSAIHAALSAVVIVGMFPVKCSACVVCVMYFVIPAMIFVSHFALDFGKYTLFRKKIIKDNLPPFLIDQLLHILVIVGIALGIYYFVSPVNRFCEASNIEGNLIFEFLRDCWTNPKIWILFLAYTLVQKPASVVLREWLRQWEPTFDVLMETPKGTRRKKTAKTRKEEEKFQKVGRMIGYFERLLILTFVLISCPEGIGFLFAAKPIYRFKDLSPKQEKRQTEYLLFGTLGSFTYAIAVGVLLKYVLGI